MRRTPSSIRSLSGGGGVVLGPTTLVLTAAFGTFPAIYNVYAPGDAPQNYAYPVPTTSPNGYGGVIIAGGVETFSGDNFYSGDTGIGGSGGLILTGTLENSGVANAGYFQNDGVVRMMTVSTGAVAGNGAFAGASTLPPGSFPRAIPASRRGPVQLGPGCPWVRTRPIWSAQPAPPSAGST